LKRIATITLNRPEKRNAISQVMLREYHQALLEADDRCDISVNLLQRAGKDFCAASTWEAFTRGARKMRHWRTSHLSA
jgi:enoyl-CoA hydratase/carnithine racemase